MRLVVLALLPLAACATSEPAAKLDTAIRTYQARVRLCEAQFPYTRLPDSERRVAAGEIEYRDCASATFEGTVLAALPLEDMRSDYRALLAEDRRLTAEVAAGRLSQGERRTALDAMTARISARQRRAAEASRNAQAARDVQDRLAEIDDLIRRGRR